jgi:hypothetical protein
MSDPNPLLCVVCESFDPSPLTPLAVTRRQGDPVCQECADEIDNWGSWETEQPREEITHDG